MYIHKLFIKLTKSGYVKRNYLKPQYDEGYSNIFVLPNLCGGYLTNKMFTAWKLTIFASLLLMVQECATVTFMLTVTNNL